MRHCGSSLWCGLRRSLVVAVLFAGSMPNSGIPVLAEEPDARLTPTVRAVKSVAASVVNIHGEKIVPANSQDSDMEAGRRVNGMGTGVVIDERGYVVTNFHVVDGVREIIVTLQNGEEFGATIFAHDTATDLAVIKIDCDDPLPVIPIGVSSDLMTGEPVIAVGNAFGYEHTVTDGIISALHRPVQVSDTQHYENLIQTDAQINPGNSGGPLVNINGKMIGINVAVRAGAQGIGFAIPVDDVLKVTTRLLATRNAKRVQHGLSLECTDGTDNLIVRQVIEGSPAAMCGLMPGDVITELNGIPITRMLDFERAFLDAKATDELAVSLRRGEVDQSARLQLAAGAVPAQSRDDQIWDVLGLRLERVMTEDFRRLSNKYRGGVLVTAVRPQSPAAQYGIRNGDVLVGLHLWATVSVNNVVNIINRPEFSDLDEFKFRIIRGRKTYEGEMAARDVERE